MANAVYLAPGITGEGEREILGPTDALPGRGVEHGGEIQPSLTGCDAGSLYKFRLDLTSGVRMSVMFRLSASDRAAIIFSLAIGAAS
ncbi:hypothetical protein, partial [Amaricoccus sp. W119]|uniref:hypothetical protein n=1 Tax=Amaricoccus sp. W119 TaxID=3391833 RepID=UPI0039A432A1